MDGKVFWRNRATGSVKWEKPKGAFRASTVSKTGMHVRQSTKLPDNWTKHLDDASGVNYYMDENGESQWERPAEATLVTVVELPEKAKEDEEFEAPELTDVKVPDGWVSHVNANGDRYYQHSESGISQWEVPTKSKPSEARMSSRASLMEQIQTFRSSLPEGWSKETDDDGDVFFVNDKNGEAQWERPDKDAK